MQTVQTEELDMIMNAAEDAGRPEETSDDGKFHIKDASEAGWAVRRIRAANTEYDEFASECKIRLEKLQAAIREINGKLNRASDERDRTIGAMNAMLREWFETLGEDKVKATKTMRKVRLPEGDLIMKTPAPTIEHDDEALTAWAQSNQYADLLNVKVTPRWADIKARIEFNANGEPIDKETGEIVPGVTAVPNEPVFEVKM